MLIAADYRLYAAGRPDSILRYNQRSLPETDGYCSKYLPNWSQQLASHQTDHRLAFGPIAIRWRIETGMGDNSQMRAHALSNSILAATLIAAPVVTSNLQASTPEVISLSGACYMLEIEYQDPDETNVFLLCLDGDRAVARMIFENKGEFPAVCYQTGAVDTKADQSLQIELDVGHCDNRRHYNAESMHCVVQADDDLFCDDPRGDWTLRYVGRLE